MKPIYFDGHNTCWAEDQPEYKALPAHTAPNGAVSSCWRLGFIERLRVLFTGNIWLQVMTFKKPLQPVILQVEKPFLDDGCSATIKVGVTSPGRPPVDLNGGGRFG